jgi:hypothetical protein
MMTRNASRGRIMRRENKFRAFCIGALIAPIVCPPTNATEKNILLECNDDPNYRQVLEIDFANRSVTYRFAADYYTNIKSGDSYRAEITDSTITWELKGATESLNRYTGVLSETYFFRGERRGGAMNCRETEGRRF